jgi:hypothetical protein
MGTALVLQTSHLIKDLYNIDLAISRTELFIATPKHILLGRDIFLRITKIPLNCMVGNIAEAIILVGK